MSRLPTPASARAMAQGAPTPPVPTSKMRQSRRGRSDEVFIEAEVSFASVGEQRENVFVRTELASDVERDAHRGATADADEQAFGFGQGHLGVVSGAIADHANLVYHVAIVVLGNEPRGEPLDLGGATLAFADRRRRRGLDGDDA